MLEEARSIGCIDFKLPPLHSTSGVVLTRAVGSMENLFLKHYPMIFKVGFCHDPVFRWCNSLYGYSTAKEKWTTLCVLYMSDEPYSVSMLEAALIEKYRSILTYIDIYCIHCFASCDFFGVRTCLAYHQQSHCRSKVSQAAGTSSLAATMSSSKTLSGMPICAMLFIDLSKRSHRPKLFHGYNFQCCLFGHSQRRHDPNHHIYIEWC